MNRRDILKSTGLVFAGSTLLPIETFALSKNDSEEKDRQAKLSQKRKLGCKKFSGSSIHNKGCGLGSCNKMR